MAEKEGLLKLVLEGLDEPITVINEKYEIVWMNRPARELLSREGCLPEEMLCYECFHARQTPCEECPLKKVRETSASFTATHEHVMPSGEGRFFEIKASPLRDVDGTFMGIVESMRDVTDRVKALDELRRLSEKLKLSNQALERFAAVVSHDLKSPLIAALASLKLIERHLRDRLGPEDEEDIAGAGQRMTNMLTLIKKLLEYSHAGSSIINPEKVELEGVLERALSNLEVEIARKKALITHDPLPAVTGDGVLLVQLLQNLIGNALKYNRSEAPRIHIHAEGRATEWIFAVSDNGIGISPDESGRIFDIFYQSRAGESIGAGIGLSTCKRIVERHGGRIWVESEPGRGSTFFFTIPREPIPSK
ncbi:MAG: ATP-binding protein [Nitrospiraceae bacterium]|nr:ATP-binding protein [Nitrospiraceae bacterium]